MASYDDVMTALRNAHAAGDTEAATRLAGIAQGYKNEESSSGEWIKSPLAQLANTADLTGSVLLGTGAGLLGHEDTTLAIEEARAKREKERLQWANPNNRDLSFMEKLGGTIATLPAQILTSGLSPVSTEKQLLDAGESTGTALGGAAIDAVGNAAGMVLPGFKEGTKLVRAASGFGANAVQDYATKAAISGLANTEKGKKSFEPTLEDAALSGIVGGGSAVALGKNKTQLKKPSLESPEKKTAALAELNTSEPILKAPEPIESPLVDTRGSNQLSKEAYAAALREQQLARESAFNRPDSLPDLTNRQSPMERMARDLGGEQPTPAVDSPMTRMAKNLEDSSTVEQRKAQDVLEARQQALEQGVNQRATLEGNAAERTRQGVANSPDMAALENQRKIDAETSAAALEQHTAKIQQLNSEIATLQDRANTLIKNSKAEKAAQESIVQRQAAMEQLMQQRVALEQQAAERAKQESAPVVSKAHQSLLDATEQARLASESDKAQRRYQTEIDDTPHVLPGSGELFGAQYGTGKGLGRVDKVSQRQADGSVTTSDMPIRADRSIEAQQLEKPLQRNLWGDELPRETTQEAIRGITKAIDITPKGEQRNAQITALGGSTPVKYNKGKMGKQRGGVLMDWGSKKKIDSLPKENILADIGDSRIATPERAVELAKTSLDVSQNIVQRGVNLLTKGGTYLKAKVNNPVVHYTVDRFLQADNKAKAEISSKLHGDYLPKLRELSNEDRTTAFEILNAADLNQKTITPDFMERHGFSQPLKDFITTHQEAMKSSLEKINASRASAGKPPIKARNAYSAMSMDGDYRKVVYKTIDGQKEVVGVIGANSKDGKFGLTLSKLEKQLLAKDGELEFGPLNDTTARTSYAKGTPHEAFRDILETLGEDNPHFAEFAQTLKDVSKDTAQNYMGMHSHTMQKKGVFGMEGRKPWLTLEQNAKEFFQNQVQYIEGTTRWGHIAEAAQDVNSVLRDDKVATKQNNAVKLSEQYMQNALGINPSRVGRAVESVFNSIFSSELADSVGLSPTRVRNALGDVKFVANTSMLSLNPSFLGIQLIQAPAAMPAMTALLRGRGLAPSITMLTGGLDSLARATKIVNLDMMGKTSGLTAVEKGALKYAEDNHVYATDMVEHANHVSKDAAYYSTKLTQAPAALLETRTRQNVFFAFVDMMHESGLTPEKGLYEQAHRMTDMAMNNYGAMEKPPIYNSLGPIGSMAYNLKSFGHNEISRWSMFAREAKNNGNYTPLLTQMATTIVIAGVMGLPFYSQWESLYNTITEKLFKAGVLDKPRNLTLDVMDASKKMGKEIPKLGEYSLSHGASTMLGADISKRVGLGDVLPNKATDVAFAGGSKVGTMASTAVEALTKQTEEHTKAAAVAFAPPVLQNVLKDAWYTKDNKSFSMDPNKKPVVTATLNDRDKLLKKLGISGINESTQKERFFQQNALTKTYDDMRKDSLVSIAQGLRNGNSIKEPMAKFIRSQGDPSTIEASLRQIAIEQNISQQDLKIMMNAASKALPKVYDLQRRTQ